MFLTTPHIHFELRAEEWRDFESWRQSQRQLVAARERSSALALHRFVNKVLFVVGFGVSDSHTHADSQSV